MKKELRISTPDHDDSISFRNAEPHMTILRMRALYPEQFYPQDWYDAESFAHYPLGIAAHVFGGGRLVPHAVACVFYHIKYSMMYGRSPLSRRYVWTSDKDVEGNRVYVGGFNLGRRPGLQIHRHLANPEVQTLKYRLD